MKLERNTIYNEDCLDTMSKMEDNFIDLVVTSPPYDDLRTYDGYTFDFENTAKGLYRVMKEGGVIVWVVGDQTKDGDESGTSFRQALYFKEIGFRLADTMIYAKGPCGIIGSSDRIYLQCFEYMFILSKSNPKTYNLIHDRKNIGAGNTKRHQKRLVNGDMQYGRTWKVMEYGRRTNVWQYAIGGKHTTRDKTAYEHPAIFPEKLARDHILSWSNEGDLVYDPFMGSGTTAVVARDFNRHYIGSEISEKYCDIIERRLNPSQMRLL